MNWRLLVVGILCHLLYFIGYYAIGRNLQEYYLLSIVFLIFYVLYDQKIGLTITTITPVINAGLDTFNLQITFFEALKNHTISGLLGIPLMYILSNHIRMSKRNKELLEKYEEQRKTLLKIRMLMPICSYCKSLRFEPGNWMLIEDFINSQHEDDIKFSHGICDDCSNRIRELAN